MLQTILIPKKFGLRRAISWVDKHAIVKKVDITNNYYRFRQSNPKKGKYYTKKLQNGIQLVFDI